jgi:hypothetical protein
LATHKIIFIQVVNLSVAYLIICNKKIKQEINFGEPNYEAKSLHIKWAEVKEIKSYIERNNSNNV